MGIIIILIYENKLGNTHSYNLGRILESNGKDYEKIDENRYDESCEPAWSKLKRIMLEEWLGLDCKSLSCSYRFLNLAVRYFLAFSRLVLHVSFEHRQSIK